MENDLVNSRELEVDVSLIICITILCLEQIPWKEESYACRSIQSVIASWLLCWGAFCRGFHTAYLYDLAVKPPKAVTHTKCDISVSTCFQRPQSVHNEGKLREEIV